jgi:hypothetical protein
LETDLTKLGQRLKIVLDCKLGLALEIDSVQTLAVFCIYFEQIVYLSRILNTSPPLNVNQPLLDSHPEALQHHTTSLLTHSLLGGS